MPSPIAHSILGFACGCGLLALVPRKCWALVLLAFIGLGCAPDIDYLPGLLRGDFNAWHHVYTHSMVWCLLVSAGAWLLWRAIEWRASWIDLAWILLALGSHLLADWFTEDRSAPFGIMLAWPLSESYSTGPVALFGAMEKHTLWSILNWNNLQPALLELLITLPLLVLALLWWKRSASLRARVNTR